MGRESVRNYKTVKINKIVVDKKLYPRDNWSFQTAYGYSQAMVAGAKFPPIVVSLTKGKYYLVDGRHRVEALKVLKETEVPAEVFVGWSKKKIFEEAVKRNITHGKSLTVHEKRMAALKLQEWKYDKAQISELVRVPLDKLDQFIEQRLINAITGDTIAVGDRRVQRTVPMIVKSGIKNATERETNTVKSINELQSSVYSGSQISLLSQLIKIIKAGYLDTENKHVRKLVKELKELI
jgi:hypothetical protein